MQIFITIKKIPIYLISTQIGIDLALHISFIFQLLSNKQLQRPID